MLQIDSAKMLRMARARTPDFKRAFGRRLTLLREALGYTTVREFVSSRLADKGISEGRCAAWERGERFPDPETLGIVMDVTGVTSDYLVYGRDMTLPRELYDKIARVTRLHTELADQQRTG